MTPDPSQAASTLRTGVPTVGDAVVVEPAELDHGIQDLVETEVSAGVEKWSVWKSLVLIGFASIGFWALMVAIYQALMS